MYTIPITDNLGATVDAALPPASALVKYVSGLPALILHGGDLSQLKGLTVDNPLVSQLSLGLTWQTPVTLGSGVTLTVNAAAGIGFQAIAPTKDSNALISPDDYGDTIAIPAGSCYLKTSLQASGGPDVSAVSGSMTFGLDVTKGIEIDCYNAYPAGVNAPSMVDALLGALADFTVPADASDLAAMPAGAVCTVCGTGSISVSATANLLAITNPLATVALPSPVPALSIQQSATVTVGASWKISAGYQVRAQKLDATRVRLGWYRKHGSDFDVTVSAGASVDTTVGAFDVFTHIIGAISSNAAADVGVLQKTGVPLSQAAAIQSAVQNAVNRKLEVSVAADFAALGSDEAAFLYEVDLAALGDAGHAAIARALAGDHSGLADFSALPSGVTGVRSILSRVRGGSVGLRINLLGIYNYASVSKLALSGTVTYLPSTGDMLIADSATASQIQTGAVNFGADEDKVRRVMAESFVLTAAYRVSGAVASQPALTSSQMYCKLDASTNHANLVRYAAIAGALGAAPPPIPAGGDFGRTTVFAGTTYTDAQTPALFLRADGTPRQHTEFESAGRQSIALLVPPDADDAFRRVPATDDAVWQSMCSQGPANFQTLFPAVNANMVLPDYVAIQWWADSMCAAGKSLAAIRQYLAAQSGGTGNDATFQKLRGDLAQALRSVAGRSQPLFGEPWGLVAMYLVSGRTAAETVSITGPSYVLSEAPAPSLVTAPRGSASAG